MKSPGAGSACQGGTHRHWCHLKARAAKSAPSFVGQATSGCVDGVLLSAAGWWSAPTQREVHLLNAPRSLWLRALANAKPGPGGPPMRSRAGSSKYLLPRPDGGSIATSATPYSTCSALVAFSPSAPVGRPWWQTSLTCLRPFPTSWDSCPIPGRIRPLVRRRFAVPACVEIPCHAPCILAC